MRSGNKLQIRILINWLNNKDHHASLSISTIWVWNTNLGISKCHVEKCACESAHGYLSLIRTHFFVCPLKMTYLMRGQNGRMFS